MFKKGIYVLTFALLSAISLQGCKNLDKELITLTNSFLDYYFKVDYTTAGTFCSDSLAKELAESLKSLDLLEPTVKEMLIKQSSEVKREIVSVTRADSRDTATVHYKIALPDYPSPVENRLIFAKNDKTWKIVSLGK
ncbi:MAG: hypothetical protein PHP30_05920 [Bacteroidales bacterium]|nr:hypothetical protein [Bacteroidales bacterium]MDD2425741.1 hypothetical protein [Bacteroidales bacterium]MDD3989615.1 hypothetical protein [Bacteroidales bacterium]MDD4638928.1 hypothetical protein [Bacteroidales bacterium]